LELVPLDADERDLFVGRHLAVSPEAGLVADVEILPRHVHELRRDDRPIEVERELDALVSVRQQLVEPLPDLVRKHRVEEDASEQADRLALVEPPADRADRVDAGARGPIAEESRDLVEHEVHLRRLGRKQLARGM
jgi:hypothetical protein